MFRHPRQIFEEAWNGFWDFTTFPWPDVKEAARDLASSKSTYLIAIIGGPLLALVTALILSQIDLNQALAELARSKVIE